MKYLNNVFVRFWNGENYVFLSVLVLLCVVIQPYKMCPLFMNPRFYITIDRQLNYVFNLSRFLF